LIIILCGLRHQRDLAGGFARSTRYPGAVRRAAIRHARLHQRARAEWWPWRAGL